MAKSSNKKTTNDENLSVVNESTKHIDGQRFQDNVEVSSKKPKTQSTSKTVSSTAKSTTRKKAVKQDEVQDTVAVNVDMEIKSEDTTTITPKPKTTRKKAVKQDEVQDMVAGNVDMEIKSEDTTTIPPKPKTTRKKTVKQDDVQDTVAGNVDMEIKSEDTTTIPQKPKTARKRTPRTTTQEPSQRLDNVQMSLLDDDMQVNVDKKDDLSNKVEEPKVELVLATADNDTPKTELDDTKPTKVKKEKKTKRKKVKYDYPLVRVQADSNVGLTKAQVEERIDRGNTNEQPNIVTKSYANIFRTNVLTLFNILNFFLATMILIYGELKNALFMGVVLCNMVVGIVQEIRSKLTLEKMSLLSSPKTTVIRDGIKQDINLNDLVLDDIIVLKQGDQVPADSVVVDGLCEVNESLLTGEQDDVHKEIGSGLMSGSFIQAGECRARVEAVGKDNYTSKLMAEAKQFKKPKSELMKSINWIIRIVTIAIFPIGILMFFTNLNTTSTINQAVTGTVASIVGMIPEGLVMLTSIALAVGVIKLAKKRTLVQDLYCIETLARVDVLCLDKTGTITEGSMQVEQTHVYSTKFGFVDDIMYNMVEALGSQGATFEAFANYFKSQEKYDIVKTIPFSSARKWSGADFGPKGRFIVGAPEFVLKSRYDLVENDAKEFTSQGFRVLVLVKTSEQLSENMDENKMRPIALIILSDKIRENAKQTFEYFAKQGVNLKVISGDNPITVSKVAERAGLMGAEKFIDASIDLDTDEKIYDACDKYTIFGRVSPKQKKVLVQSLKQKGYTVGMTGDGVNDVMALKEADCSIAMASGSEASRNVAQLVLLDSDFSALPSVVGEGRRVINNIERAASLFLVKTTYSIILSLLLIIFQMNYPFEPIQLTLISGLFVGIPSFFLALEPNDTKVSGSFLSKVFKKAIPAGLTVATMVWIISYIYRDIGIDVSAQISTMSFYVTSVVAVLVLLQVCLPYNKERLFLIAISVVVYIAVISSDFLRGILALVPLTTDMIVKNVIIMLCAPIMILFMRAEVEAFKALFAEIKQFFIRNGARLRKLFGKDKKADD